MLHIFIADDHTVVRNGLKMLLETNDNMTIVGEAADGHQALDFLEQNEEVDLVLSDINMPELDGIGLTRAIKARGYAAKVVLLSVHEQENYLYDAFRAGADGYLLKSAAIEELVFALRHVYSGKQYVCSSLMKDQLSMNMQRTSETRLAHPGDIELSPREMEVLELIATGMTNMEIAEKLFLSKRTIEGHRQSLIDKFAVHNTAELVCLSMRAGMLS